MRSVGLALVLCLLVAGTAAAITTWRLATVSGPAEKTLAELIQTEHVRVCGKALTLDSQLIWAARYKAQDMGYRNRLSHTFIDGKRIWDFYAEAGISKRYGAGENIGWNNYPDDESARRMFRGFMDSAGHRALIRNCDYDRFGVGAFQTKGGSTEGKKWYAVEFTNISRP